MNRPLDNLTRMTAVAVHQMMVHESGDQARLTAVQYTEIVWLDLARLDALIDEYESAMRQDPLLALYLEQETGTPVERMQRAAQRFVEEEKYAHIPKVTPEMLNDLHARHRSSEE